MQVKSVKSLSRLCECVILHNMKLFLSESDIVALMDNELDLENNTNNPFDQLPSNVVDGFLNFTCKSIFVFLVGDQYRPRAIEYLPLLITPHLTELEIPFMACGKLDQRKKDTHYILRLASVRSKQLKILRMRLMFYYDSAFPFHINLICKFSKLQVLDVSTDDLLSKLPRFPSAQDEFLHLLGQHCTELRELSARYHPITDAGIRGLCVIGNCRSIRLLNFYGCKAITNQGIKTAFDNLPFLKILWNEATIDGLAEIAQNAADQGLPIPKYALSALYILKGTVYKGGSLEKSVLLCPYITKVDMTLMCDGIVKDADLVSLLSLKSLYILEIDQRKPLNFNEATFRYSGGITFEGGVFPLLKKFGNSLKKLELDVFFLDLDILTIMQFCHKLQYLCLHMRSKFDRWPKEEEQKSGNKREIPILKHLEELMLCSDDSLHSFVPAEIVLTLLSSPLLSFISIKLLNNLTDKIIRKATHVNSFRHLERLWLTHCNEVTKYGVNLFLQQNIPLKSLKLHRCDKITFEDSIEWEETLTKNNWELELEIRHPY